MLLFPLLILVSPAWAELDLDKEVMIIPDTHNEKPYVWHVERNPKGYELVLSADQGKVNGEQAVSFKIVSPSDIQIKDVHIFITGADLESYFHRKAVRAADEYRFTYRPSTAGKDRFEVVFQTQKGWVDLRKDVKIGGGIATADKLPGDEDYQVKIKLIPKKAYAEHVVTFLYEILYKGKPLKALEKMDGFDMQVAAWDEDLKEFIYATPK